MFRNIEGTIEEFITKRRISKVSFYKNILKERGAKDLIDLLRLYGDYQQFLWNLADILEDENYRSSLMLIDEIKELLENYSVEEILRDENLIIKFLEALRKN